MRNLRIRRRRINYLLPSEGVEILNRMIGKTINKFMLGTRYLSKEGSSEITRGSGYRSACCHISVSCSGARHFRLCGGATGSIKEIE